MTYEEAFAKECEAQDKLAAINYDESHPEYAKLHQELCYWMNEAGRLGEEE